jgi:hypothetical protein
LDFRNLKNCSKTHFYKKINTYKRFSTITLFLGVLSYIFDLRNFKNDQKDIFSNILQRIFSTCQILEKLIINFSNHQLDLANSYFWKCWISEIWKLLKNTFYPTILRLFIEILLAFYLDWFKSVCSQVTPLVKNRLSSLWSNFLLLD